MLVVALVFGVGIFFLLPLFLAQATVGRVDQGFGLQLSEGLIRVVIFIGYLLLVSRAPDVRRTFQYHGAEHMSIHTLEAGDPLTVAAARKYPTAHPRCGTEFLVVVLLISILAFAVVGKLAPVWLVVSRIVLIPVIAAVSYELLQLGARHRDRALVRWLWSPGIWVQMITTSQPSDDMIEVALVSLERALIADGNEIPPGSAVLACRPLSPAADLGAVAGGAEDAGGPEAAP
jgi:Predicted metal-dependent enzyme